MYNVSSDGKGGARPRRSPPRPPCPGSGISAGTSDPAPAPAPRPLWKPEEGSISHRVQRLAKHRFMKKQSVLLLNADDLDAIWVRLRENCVIDDSTGDEKMNYEDFCQIASICMEPIGPKC
ncbi:unnamed protein product [Musa banksii]